MTLSLIAMCRFGLLTLFSVLLLSPAERAIAQSHEFDAATIRSALRHGGTYSTREVPGSSYLMFRSGPGTAHDAQLVDGGRSVALAAGMSAILPGAGQVYNGQMIKAAIAVAVEATLIAVMLSKRSSGQDAEVMYQAFAHEDWSASRYGSWLNDYVTYLNSELGANIDVPMVTTSIGVDLQQPDDWSAADRAAVASMIAEINRVERSVFHPETGASFSHQLPPFADQQYYELIGKYFQFAPGWDDYPAWIDGDGNFTLAIDPELTGSDGSKPNVQGKFRQYARDHAHSQDLLRTASTFGLLIALNHMVAAVDAAVTAKLFNDRLSTRMSVSVDAFGAPTPKAAIGFRL